MQQPDPGPVVPQVKVLAGFNQNWSFMPAFNSSMLSNISLLKPEMIRYPGGTVAHDWDWISGKKNNASNGTPHLVSDIQVLKAATGAKMILVLDIVNRTINDQLDMLTAINNAGVPVEYIELGNELYANDPVYETAFPTGADYAAKVVLWSQQIRAVFPAAKISALLQCRNAASSVQRFAQWNSLVVNGTTNAVDAFTYHIYIPVGGSFATRKNEFETVAANTATGNKELWITEYGNQNDLTDPNYYSSLDSLADFIEKRPKVTIALNHLIVGNNKNKLTADGSSFTPEGQLFLTRALKR